MQFQPLSSRLIAEQSVGGAMNVRMPFNDSRVGDHVREQCDCGPGLPFVPDASNVLPCLGSIG
jgi:hypothetical protein